MREHRLRHLVLREAKLVLIGWSLLCAVGATVGGVIGYVTWADAE